MNIADSQARPLRILMVTAELAPAAKTGGLADMVAGLGAWLARQGHDVRILLPHYGAMHGPAAGVPVVAHDSGPVRMDGRCPGYALRAIGEETQPAPRVYLLDAPAFFGSGAIYGHGDRDALRFALLAHAALDLCHALDWPPDLIHCHDWHAGLVPLLLSGPAGSHPLFHETYTVLTIHNIGYQGDFAAELAADCGLAPEVLVPRPAAGHLPRLNFLLTGIEHADALTTVSPTHALEIQTPAYGMGLDETLRHRRHRLRGILNGVDYRCWDPADDPLIPCRFSAADPERKADCRAALAADHALDLPPERPLIGMVTRLARQKGIDLVLEVLPALLADGAAGAIILGNGEPGYAEALRRLADSFQGRLAFLQAQDEAAAHRIFAGADLFLVPSLYEPCGLTQMYALRYGAIPVVRETGGLKDTIRHFDPLTGSGNGSVFRDADAEGLRWGLRQALGWYRDEALHRRVMANAMAADFSWDRQGPYWMELYLQLTGISPPPPG